MLLLLARKFWGQWEAERCKQRRNCVGVGLVRDWKRKRVVLIGDVDGGEGGFDGGTEGKSFQKVGTVVSSEKGTPRGRSKIPGKNNSRFAVG